MKINLTNVENYKRLFRGNVNGFTASICRNMLIILGANSKTDTCKMTIRLKNPKKAGFIKVILTRGGKVKNPKKTGFIKVILTRGGKSLFDNVYYWTWEIPSMKKQLENEFKTFWDTSTMSAVSSLFSSETTGAIVWVKVN